jgi:hypothetical protein
LGGTKPISRSKYKDAYDRYVKARRKSNVAEIVVIVLDGIVIRSTTTPSGLLSLLGCRGRQPDSLRFPACSSANLARQRQLALPFFSELAVKEDRGPGIFALLAMAKADNKHTTNAPSKIH